MGREEIKAAWDRAMCGYRPGRDGPWRCVLYLCPVGWGAKGGAIDDSGLSALEAKALAQIGRKDDIELLCTIVGTGDEFPFDGGYREMLDLVEQREVDCVAVPDIHYLGTSMQQALVLLQRTVVPAGMRFLDAAQRFDSLSCDVDAYFERVRHAEDAVRRKAGSNRPVSRGQVPYGYVFDEGSRGRMRVDEVAAGAVRTICEMTLDGMPASGIARRLNEQKVPNPQRRRRELYGFKAKAGSDSWTGDQVKRIAYSPAIAGHRVLGRYVPSRPGGHSQMRSLDECKVVRNHHEAIIGWETYEALATLRKSRERKTNGEEEQEA